LDRAEAVACLLTALALAGCSGRPGAIRVGSKNFTEQVILGEIAAQHLENKLHAALDRRLNLGGTLLAHQALAAGQIDLYPEYTGTALMAILKLPPATDPRAVFERVRGAYARLGLAWMPPLGFNNGFAMVIRGADARRLATLSDAAGHNPGWTLGVGYEFLTRPDGFPALMSTYHLPLQGDPKSMDLGLLYQALEQGRVSMAAGSDTDGMIQALDVRVLQDDKRAFPPYQAALVVREKALAAHPGLRDALAALSGKITVEDMRAMNRAVDGEHRPVAEVARAFLRRAGL
jgi:osmoprotectant transport system substrate-binding protein